MCRGYRGEELGIGGRRELGGVHNLYNNNVGTDFLMLHSNINDGESGNSWYA